MGDKTNADANGEQKAQMNETEMLERVRFLISKDELDKLPTEIKTFPLTGPEKNDISLVLRKYEGGKKDNRRGVMSKQDFDVIINQTGKNLLDYFLEKSIEKSEIQKLEIANEKEENTKKEKQIEELKASEFKNREWLTIFFILFLIASTAAGWLFYKLENEKLHITLFGSGSVYTFLKENIPNLFEKNYDISFSPVEVKSNAAKEVIKSSYQRGEESDENNRISGILGMSASSINDDAELVKTKNYYSFQLATDTPSITFGLKKINGFCKDSADIKKLIPTGLSNEELYKFLSMNEKYSIYATDTGSGTLDCYIKCVPNFDFKKPKLNLFNPFDLSNETAPKLANEKKSWIILGSNYYNYEHFTKKEKRDIESNFCVYNIRLNCVHVKPIILYFRLSDDSGNFPNHQGHGYKLDDKKQIVLTQLFEEFGILEDLRKNNTFNLKILEDGKFGILYKDGDTKPIFDDFRPLLKGKLPVTTQNWTKKQKYLLIYFVVIFVIAFIIVLVKFYFRWKNKILNRPISSTLAL